MKVQTKNLGHKAITVRLAIYKVCITACFAIIISLFLFACGSAKESSESSDTTAVMQSEPAPATADTATMPADTTGARRDTTPM
jgi:hypothetical protein